MGYTVECKCGRGRGKGTLEWRLIGSVGASATLAVPGNGARDILVVAATFTPTTPGDDSVALNSAEISGGPMIASAQYGTPGIRLHYADHGDVVMGQFAVATGADVTRCYVWEAVWRPMEVK